MTNLTPPTEAACGYIISSWRQFFSRNPAAQSTLPSLIVEGPACSRKDALVALVWAHMNRITGTTTQEAADTATRLYAHPSTHISGRGICVQEDTLRHIVCEAIECTHA